MTRRDTERRLADWFEEWRTPLRRFLARRGTVRGADLEDVAQEVFLRLLRYDKATLIEHPQAYLFKMASNVAAEWAIRSRNRHPHNARWLADIPAEESPEADIERASARAEITRAIAMLPPRQRELLRLHFGEKMSHARMAEQLGLSTRVVKRDLIKAYSRLRRTLDATLLACWSEDRDAAGSPP